jgi:hypothetical protein
MTRLRNAEPCRSHGWPSNIDLLFVAWSAAPPQQRRILAERREVYLLLTANRSDPRFLNLMEFKAVKGARVILREHADFPHGPHQRGARTKRPDTSMEPDRLNQSENLAHGAGSAHESTPPQQCRSNAGTLWSPIFKTAQERL